jgi:hypothetical protein
MKSTLLLLPFLLCAVQFCKGQQIDSVHQKKAEKIIQRVASGKPLPKSLNGDNGQAQDAWGGHHHGMFYRTTRMMRGQMPDSVFMDVFIEDSLMDLEFDEAYLGISEGVNGYHYNIQKGEMTWAYVSMPIPDSLRNKSRDERDSVVVFYDNAIHDESLTIDKYNGWKSNDKVQIDKRKDEDHKRQAFYMPKLLASIDELYDLLFK